MTPPPPVPDLTAIRARLEKVAEAARMGEISVFNNEHIASWGDIDALLREVDRLRGEMEKAESRLTALDDNRDKWKARAESAEARLTVIQALPRYSPYLDPGYPQGNECCCGAAMEIDKCGDYVLIDDIDAVLAGQGPQP